MLLRRFLSLCAFAWPVTAAAQFDGRCEFGCGVEISDGSRFVLEICRAIDCLSIERSGPAWEAGRIDDPDHGGYAAVSNQDLSQQLIITCESRGPLSVVLRTATLDRGRSEWIIDGQSVEWLDLQQLDGVLFAEIPRASRLIFALEDGVRLTVLSFDGLRQIDFGLRGSARAIEQAMHYCSER